jgi:hypothetical protein
MRVRKPNRDPACLLSPIQLVSSLLFWLVWPLEDWLLHAVIIYGTLLSTNVNDCPCFLFFRSFNSLIRPVGSQLPMKRIPTQGLQLLSNQPCNPCQ